jgi:antitoxin ParD1/3/4
MNVRSERMNLAITPELQKLIEQRMKSGRYATAQDVVAAALHALDQDDRLGDFESGELEQLLAEGENSGAPLDGEKVLAELRSVRLGRQREGR